MKEGEQEQETTEDKNQNEAHEMMINFFSKEKKRKIYLRLLQPKTKNR